MTSKSKHNSKDGAVLADINSDQNKTNDKADGHEGKSVLSKINEDQSKKKSDAD